MSMEITYLAHHGILGQKWGVRRYQNKDGTLTDLGKKHYTNEYLNGKISASNPLNDVKSTLLKSDSIANKANIRDISNFWEKLEALEDLGLGDKDIRDITDSEWKQIDARANIKHSEETMEITYLAHHGILGQKWGRRRYQNKDGTLTVAGLKRYADAKTFVSRVEQRNGGPVETETKKKLENTKAKPKSVSEMSDEELIQQINRMRLEKTFYEAKAEISKLNTKPVSKGEKFLNQLQDAAIGAVKQNAGKWGEMVIKSALGIDSKKKESIDDKIKKAQLEKTIAETEKTKAEAANARAKAKTKEK